MDFKHQQDWAYSVLLNNIHTIVGKEIVRSHRQTADARQILFELGKDATISATGQMRQNALRLQITTTHIEAKHSHSQLTFIAMYEGLIEKHNKTCSTPDLIIPVALAKESLKAAVVSAPNLRDVTTREIENTVSDNKPPYSYMRYLHCLKTAAALNDGVPDPRVRTRRAHMADSYE